MMESHKLDLQATYQTLEMIEQSKEHSDGILDNFPGIFLVVTEEGRILKACREVSRLLQVEFEKLEGKSFSSLFVNESWKYFQSQFSKITDNNRTGAEFELTIKDQGEDRDFLWHITPFRVKSRPQQRLFTVIGRDISELRTAEKRLSSLFSSIPLGIFNVNADGNIDKGYSAYTEWLLGTEKLAGRNFVDLVFKQGFEKFSGSEKDAIAQLPGTFGKMRFHFDSVRDFLPREIPFKVRFGEVTVERYLGLTYQAIVSNDLLSMVLVVVDDRTSMIETRNAAIQEKMQQERGVVRLIQVQKSPPEVLPIVMAELDEFFSKMDFVVESRNLDHIKHMMHSIKGESRIMGFEFLAKAANDVEAIIGRFEPKNYDNLQEPVALTPVELTEDAWKQILASLVEVRHEWKEIQEIYEIVIRKKSVSEKKENKHSSQTMTMLLHRYNEYLSSGRSEKMQIVMERLAMAMASVSLSSPSVLDELLKLRAEETARKLGKRVEVYTEWADFRLDEYTKTCLSECLLHLINNAVAHGIESPEVRTQKGKAEVGRIDVFSICDEHGELTCEFHDDGAGVNIEKVKALAVKKGLITFDQVMSLKKSEQLQLIFKPGFSTAETVDEVSGRGVGLDAVVNILAKFNGSIEVDNIDSGGAVFLMKMCLPNAVKINWDVVPLIGFVQELLDDIAHMAAQESFAIKISEKSRMATWNGIAYLDYEKIKVAVTSIVGHFAVDKEVLVTFDREGADLLFEIQLQGDHGGVSRRHDRPEFELVMRDCLEIIKKHGGALIESENNIVIRFGHLIGREQVSVVKVRVEKDLPGESVKKTSLLLGAVAGELGIALDFNETTDSSGSEAIGSENIIVIGDSPRANVNPSSNNDKMESVLVTLVRTVLKGRQERSI